MRSFVCAALLMLGTSAMAEPLAIAFNDPSGQYLVEVLFPEVPAEHYQLAKAFITLRDKTTLKELQRVETAAGNVPLDNAGKPLTADSYRLLGPNGLLYFVDFNFDGRLDLAVRNGTEKENESDSEPTFDIYLQDSTQPHWTLSPALNELARQSFGGMFSPNIKTRRLQSQSDRGCCWTRFTELEIHGDTLTRISEYTQEEVPATEFGENNSMPKGYMLRTTGKWVDGQWVEKPSLEGPVNEDTDLMKGTLNGKIPVEIWWQQQGSVLIGEVRYLKGGSGEPIKLVGELDDCEGLYCISLYEYAADGRRTGIWRIVAPTAAPYNYTGTWVSGTEGDDRELPILLSRDDREPEYDKYSEVERNQRTGHYQMRQDFMGRDGDLDLKILPERDAQGREVAEFTVTLKGIITEHHIVPMEAENLIIVREPEASKLNGPYHIQLVKNFAVIRYNAQPDTRDFLTGMYIKQP